MRKRKSVQSLKKETQNAVRSLIITLTAMICILAVAFLFMTGEKAQKGYEILQLREEKEFLETESTKLTTRVTEANAFSKIQEEEKATSMDDITDIAEEDKIFITGEDNKLD
ncbi:hypothetical protein ACFL21_02985 [Patescibacteria group bacterium]